MPAASSQQRAALSFPLAILFLLAISIPALSAGQAIEHAYIGYVYPAGGQQGTSVNVVVGGNDIYGATAAQVTGPGVSVEVVDSNDPQGLTEEERRKRQRRSKSNITEKIKLCITIAADAEPGERNLCLVTPDGVSNQRVFQVGQLKEQLEGESKAIHEAPMPITALPVALNGQIMPGDTDLYRFTAKRGQRLVAEVAARGLIPYIADAVPGWFQALITLTNADGREVACSDSFRFSQDPVLFYEVPADGTYTLAIRDSIYRGRADFIYRLRLGELPYITSIFPLGARAGSTTTAAVSGWNLPATTLDITLDPGEALVRQVQMLGADGLLSNRVPFAISTQPELPEAATPSSERNPQMVSLPVVINGRISKADESDWFRFHGSRNQAVAIEVRARRLGSPLDACLVLSNSTGEVVAENDDVQDKSEGLLTHQADALVHYRLPEEGFYTVRLFDLQGKGGEDYAYRLRFGPYAPDFELRATPAALELSRGGSATFTVHVLRHDGFSRPITVEPILPMPEGLTLAGGYIPAGIDRMRMTISASAEAPATGYAPQLAGHALIHGKPVTRPVVFAEEQMQAFIYQHLVPSRESTLIVTDPPAAFTLCPQLPESGYLEITPDREVSFPVTVTRRPGSDGTIRLTLLDPPKGITLLRGTIAARSNRTTVTIEADESVAIGRRDNLILIGTMPLLATTDAEKAAALAKAEKKAAKTPGAAEKKGNKKPLYAGKIIEGMPAIPLRVVAGPDQAPDRSVPRKKK